MNQVLLEPDDLREDGTARLTGRRLRHALGVLRAAPPRPGIDLLLAVPRPKALRKILPAAASLGVDRIVLVNAARVGPFRNRPAGAAWIPAVQRRPASVPRGDRRPLPSGRASLNQQITELFQMLCLWTAKPFTNPV